MYDKHKASGQSGNIKHNFSIDFTEPQFPQFVERPSTSIKTLRKIQNVNILINPKKYR